MGEIALLIAVRLCEHGASAATDDILDRAKEFYKFLLECDYGDFGELSEDSETENSLPT